MMVMVLVSFLYYIFERLQVNGHGSYILGHLVIAGKIILVKHCSNGMAEGSFLLFAFFSFW